ncbi:MAG: hypothetical protein ACP5O1_02195 [Phycisphaerae bacterium]
MVDRNGVPDFRVIDGEKTGLRILLGFHGAGGRREFISIEIWDFVRRIDPTVIMNNRLEERLHLKGYGDYSTPEQFIPRGGFFRSVGDVHDHQQHVWRGLLLKVVDGEKEAA